MREPIYQVPLDVSRFTRDLARVLAHREAQPVPAIAEGPIAEAWLSSNGTVLAANRAFSWIFGFDRPEDLVGYNTENLCPHDISLRGQVEEELGRAEIRAGRPYGNVRSYRIPTGEVVRLALRLRFHAATDRMHMRGIFLEEDARPEPDSEAENILCAAEGMERLVSLEIERRRQVDLAALSTLAWQAVDNSVPLLQAAAELVAKHLDVPIVGVVERDHLSEALWLRASVGGSAYAGPYPLTPGSPAAHTWATGEASVVEDWALEQNFSYPPAMGELGVRSCATIAICGRAARWGVIAWNDRRPRSFRPTDIVYVQNIANVVGECLALAAAEREVATLAEMVRSAPVMIVRFDLQRRLLYLNAAARLAFGIGPDDDCCGISVDRLLTPLDADLETISIGAKTQGRALTRRDCLGHRSDGTTFPANTLLSVELGLDGEPVSFTFFGVDITEGTQARRELESLARRLESERETQARHYAMELHDDLGQTLAATRLAVAAIGRGPPEEIPGRVASALEALGDALQSLRRITNDMRPLPLERGGVDDAFRTLCERQAAMSGIVIQFRCAGTVDALSVPVATTLYRVAQEALANATRHGRPSRIDVGLRASCDSVTLTVVDDGAGFDPAQRSPCLGLTGMRERLLARSGTLEIVSAPGTGTRVTARVPLAADSSEAIRRGNL